MTGVGNGTGFAPEVLERLATTDEIRMETRRRKDGRVGSRPIWVVVEDGEVFVRANNGKKGAWYRQITSNPPGEVRFGGERVPVRATPVEDQEDIERVSDAYRSKYGGSYPGSTRDITRGEILDATLRLEPQAEEDERGGRA